MPDNTGTHLQVMAAVVQAMQEAALKDPTSPIEEYSCDLHILDSICQAQQVDPTLSPVIARLWDGTLG